MTQERIGRRSKRLRVRCAHDMPAVRLVGHCMTIQGHWICRTLPVLPGIRSPCSFFANTRTCRHALTPAWHSRSGRYKSIVYCLAARSFSAGAPPVPARSLSRHPFRPWKPYSWLVRSSRNKTPTRIALSPVELTALRPPVQGPCFNRPQDTCSAIVIFLDVLHHD